MQTLQILQSEVSLEQLSAEPKHYLAISNDGLVVLLLCNESFKTLEVILDGKDKDAYVCEFEDINDMLEVITIVKTAILAKGYIDLEDHFNANFINPSHELR